MVGAQLASRVIYPHLGPRRHVSLGLVGVASSIAALALLTTDSSLWWARLLMFTLGLSMAQVFVPTQAAAFASVSPAATGRASTMYNAVRQLGGAVGIALLTTVIIGVGAATAGAGHSATDLTAYRIAFLIAAAVALATLFCSLTIHDADAADTIPARKVGKHFNSERELAPAAA
jgi:MFS family permease